MTKIVMMSVRIPIELKDKLFEKANAISKRFGFKISMTQFVIKALRKAVREL